MKIVNTYTHKWCGLVYIENALVDNARTNQHYIYVYWPCKFKEIINAIYTCMCVP